jgi:tetratricopeptide (TPR) repeat protein
MQSGGLLVSLRGDFRDTSLIDAAQNVGNSLTEDSMRRAQYWEVMHLSCLEKLLWIPNYRGYFHTPHILHKTRAQAHLREGRFEEARREMRTSRTFMPGNIELAEHLVPALEEAEQQALADELFDETYKFVSEVCLTFPESALHHNNLAWLCARCDRQLDVALNHVQRALELVPQAPSYLDTLGEVHFRRGEFSDAIRCAKECIALEPENEFFQQQLKRFEQAGADS